MVLFSSVCRNIVVSILRTLLLVLCTLLVACKSTNMAVLISTKVVTIVLIGPNSDLQPGQGIFPPTLVGYTPTNTRPIV